MSDTPPLTVFYDGACPLCSREIGFYRTCAGADAVAWVDVSQADDATPVAPGLSREAALAALHVRTADGRLVSGGQAFARLWTALPAFRRLGRMGRSRPGAWLLDGAYRLFLRLRPALTSVLKRLP